MALDEPNDTEQPQTINDLAVLMAEDVKPHAAKQVLDYVVTPRGEGFAIAPTRLHEQVTAVAAGDTATIARTADGTLWQWDKGGVARRLVLKED